MVEHHSQSGNPAVYRLYLVALGGCWIFQHGSLVVGRWIEGFRIQYDSTWCCMHETLAALPSSNLSNSISNMPHLQWRLVQEFGIPSLCSYHMKSYQFLQITPSSSVIGESRSCDLVNHLKRRSLLYYEASPTSHRLTTFDKSCLCDELCNVAKGLLDDCKASSGSKVPSF